jgi:hypothetical protein
MLKIFIVLFFLLMRVPRIRPTSTDVDTNSIILNVTIWVMIFYFIKDPSSKIFFK